MARKSKRIALFPWGVSGWSFRVAKDDTETSYRTDIYGNGLFRLDPTGSWFENGEPEMVYKLIDGKFSLPEDHREAYIKIYNKLARD